MVMQQQTAVKMESVEALGISKQATGKQVKSTCTKKSTIVIDGNRSRQVNSTASDDSNCNSKKVKQNYE